MKTDKILYGAAYYDEYMPCDRIEKDMEMMSAAGINVIRIAESTWSSLEPHDGIFDFTHLERMLLAATKYNISVIVGTPTYAIPTWLMRKYPDILAVPHSGENLYGHRQNMNIIHEGYRAHAKRVIEKLMQYTCNRPCVIGYQVDNETRSYDTSGPDVQKAFIEYLKIQYPDIQEFNEEYGFSYWSNRINSWEDFPDVRGTINQSLDAEFRKFQRLLVTDFFNWQIEIINHYIRKDQFITHNFDYGWNGYSYGMQPEVNQYEACKNMTVVGTDIYHPTASKLSGVEIAFGGALMYSLKEDNYLVLETQAQGNLGWLPYPGQLRLQAYSHIASGANSVLYWHWHSIHNAIESYWKGILSHNLKENATYKEICQIGNEFKSIGNRINNLTKNNKVAIMVNNESLTGMNEFPINDKLSYNHILRWIYEELYKLNIECDFIPQQSDLNRMSQYQIIIIPAMYSATEDSINHFKEYTANGGHLIMTFKSCFSDEHLKIYHDDQPHLLTECFGMTYDQFTIDDTVSLANTAFDADGVGCGDFMELLIPKTADTLAKYDNPAYKDFAAVTANSYYKGRAVYIGCFFDSVFLSSLLQNELATANIDIPKIRYPIICKTGMSNGHKVVFYFNYSASEVSFNSEYSGKDILENKTINIEEKIIIKPWGLTILEV